MLHSQTFQPGDALELASKHDGAQASRALLIENEILRYGMHWRKNYRAAILKFAPEIEQSFEDDTLEARSRELRLTISFGVYFFLATSITDFILVPDIQPLAEIIRVCNVPLLLVPVLFGSRMPGLVRELVSMLVAMIAIVTLATIPVISTAPLAPFAFATATLAVIYANSTFPLRFKYAVFCSVTCCVIIGFETCLHPGVEPALGYMLTFQAVVGGSYSLINSYRTERGTRLNYLLSSREALRLRTLAADREFLTALSNTDALTGLLNRRHFDRESEIVLSASANAGKPVALLFIDVDFFKRYNDRYGHPAGDGCLRAVASTISEAVRGTDKMAARYGGEEFAILLLDVTEAQAETIAERVCRSVSARSLQHLNRNDGFEHVTISVGVACGVAGSCLSLDKLIESADSALYAAKRAGRNRVQFEHCKAA